MKFKFDLEVSKVLDYLIYPRLYYYMDEDMNKKNDILETVIKDEFYEFIEHTRLHLEPYKEEIMKFYQKDIYAEYDFANILIHAYPIYTYKDENDYFNDIMKDDEQTLRKNIIKTLITMDEDHKNDDESQLSEANAVSFINELKIDASNKWNLLMMIQNPKKCLTEMIQLLEKVRPMFYQYYDKVKEEVNQTGIKLAKKLSVNTNETFKEMTYDSIAYDFGDNDICYLYISAFFQYTLRFIDDEPCRICWGLDMERSFEKLHQINEDKLTQRVKIFKALGDKTRYDTLKLLASGVTSIKNIATELDVSSATISYHINEFLTSGIITLKKEKNKKSGYKVDYKKLEEVITNFKKDLEFPN